MTDRELADAAWLELTKTTDSYPAWVKKNKPASSHWAHAKGLLEQIGLAPPLPPPPPTPDPALRRIVVPAYSSGATIVTTLADARAALANKVGGELVIRNVTFPIDAYTFNRNYQGLKVWFENSPFVGGAAGTAPLYGCWIKGPASGLSLYGLDVTNPAGTGLGITGGAHDLTIQGKVHHTGAQGFFVAANYGADVYNLDCDIDTSDAGNDLTQDPHAEKGTGLHVAYLGSSPTGNTVRDSKFTIIGHDGKTGSIQFYSAMQNCDLWIDARRLSFAAQSQVAGSPAQFGGSQIKDVRIRYLYAEDCVGRVVDTNTLSSGPVVVEYARWKNCATNPKVAGQYLQPNAGITYLDCRAVA